MAIKRARLCAGVIPSMAQQCTEKSMGALPNEGKRKPLASWPGVLIPYAIMPSSTRFSAAALRALLLRVLLRLALAAFLVAHCSALSHLVGCWQACIQALAASRMA